MKLPLSCHECSKNNMSRRGSIAWVEFRDDSRYEFTCPQGHETTTILQEQKFEVLFEIGAYAIKDGYYREAVSSFSSSLERFYEFVIRVLLLKQEIDLSKINKSWKLVANQSERQLGAFIYLYLREFGDLPVLLDQNKIAFRNSVIHKGVIPNREQALTFGQAILDVCRPIIVKLTKDYADEVNKTIVFHLRDSRTENDTNKSVATLGMLQFYA